MLQWFKQSLTRIGSNTSTSRLHQLQMVLNYMRLGRWMADQGYTFAQRAANRDGVFDAVAQQVRHQRVLYLEFGVFQGASMRYWSRALQHPDSQLHGFDSFEGLPEDFDLDGGMHKKGVFNVQGAVPDIPDPRVHFHRGWFEETVPKFIVPEHEVLVMNLDADLYSSTILVLNTLAAHIRPGSFLYFDDMSRPDHEPRAFAEFAQEQHLSFRPVAADQSLNCAFFQCSGSRDSARPRARSIETTTQQTAP